MGAGGTVLASACARAARAARATLLPPLPMSWLHSPGGGPALLLHDAHGTLGETSGKTSSQSGWPWVHWPAMWRTEAIASVCTAVYWSSPFSCYTLMEWQQAKRCRACCSATWRCTQRAACSSPCGLVLQHHPQAQSLLPAVQSTGCLCHPRPGSVGCSFSPQLPPPSLWEDCRGNTVYVVSAANAGCSQGFNEVLRVKCRSNLLIALRGRQIALNHSFLSCKLIKEYRGAFKWGSAAGRTLLVCIRIWAGTAVPLFFCLSRGSKCSCGSFPNACLWVSGAKGREKGRISTRLVPSFAPRISGLPQLLCAAELAYFKLVFERGHKAFSVLYDPC